LYNKTGMIADSRQQNLYILNLTLVDSTIRNDSTTLLSYSDSDSGTIWIGETSGKKYGVERYFEYTDDIDTYGVETEDVLLNLKGYVDNSITIVNVTGRWQYNEVALEEGDNYTVSNYYSIIINSETTLDNYTDLIISYAIELDADKVMEYTFSEANGFEFSDVILSTDTTPIQLDRDNYLGKFYSIFNESYTSLDVFRVADLNIGFTGITIDNFEFLGLSDMSGNPISATYTSSIIGGDQVSLDFENTIPSDVYIQYGIQSYKLDRGYQRIDMGIDDAVRKLSKRDNSHTLFNHSDSSYLNLLTIPDDPQDPIEAGTPKIIIPLLEENNKTSISFNYLALLYNSVLNGSFYLDDAVLSGGTQYLKPILATFTFTTEDGESYFDYVEIDPTKGNRFDFEINLQPMYSVKGYTTYDIEIDFLAYGDNPITPQYVLFDIFELTTDDRIIQTIDKPSLSKKNELQISNIINTPQYMQIFTNNLMDEYGVLDDSWLTISAEGFGDYGELVKLYRDTNDELTFEAQTDDEFYFQSTAATDRRLTDSLGFHLNAYDLELPEYIEGEINLYAGKGTYPYGEVYESDVEFSMDWGTTGNSNYTVNINSFNAHDYNSQNFPLSTLPLTGQNTYIEGELYLHHRIDLTDSANIITTGLPTNVEFAVIIPNATSRIPSLSVKSIDQIGTPWDWVESWQGFALTESDYQLYNPDSATFYNPSVPLTEGTHYDVVVNSEGRDQINFHFIEPEIINLLLGGIVQIDFHIDYEFKQSDYAIEEDSNTYNSEIHWRLPDNSYLYWNQFEYHPDLTSTATFYISYSHLSEYTPPDDFKTTLSETFTFYPREYNFTEITFTGFDDDEYEVTLNLTYGGDFQNRWDDVKPFGMTIQTTSGERYLSHDYMRNWQQDSQYPD
ncbi:hypothetical protein LCGC14_1798020, partial [marine sediment metagenome]